MHNALQEPHHPDEMVVKADETSCRVWLACKHWSHPIHPASSSFDFPEETLYCMTCKDDRQMHPTLQWALQRAIDDGAATWQDLA